MTQPNSFKLILNQFTFPFVALPLLALASGCAIGGYDASDMIYGAVASGGHTDDEPSAGSGGASGGSTSDDETPGGGGSAETGNGTGGDAATDLPSDGAPAVPDEALVGATAVWLDHDITIERAETTTTVETNPKGEEYVSRLHSMTVKVQSRDGRDDLRGEAWELALADGTRVPPLCAPEPGSPGVIRFRYDFFYDSERPFVGAWLERSAQRDGAPVTIALDSFVKAEEVSPED